MKVLSVTELSKKYGKEEVLKSLSLSINPGEIHGLLGPNGSGKSTSLHIITGLITCSSGAVEICNKNITKKESRIHLGFLPDDLPIPDILTGREYIKFFNDMRMRDDLNVALKLSRIFKIHKALDKPIVEYSHGMRRKIQLVTAIMHRPELLILDEPYRGLDPESIVILKSIIYKYKESGRSVLIATHDMLRAETECDTVTIVNKGSIVIQGSPESIKNKYHSLSLEEAFLKSTGLENKIKLASEEINEILDYV